MLPKQISKLSVKHGREPYYLVPCSRPQLWWSEPGAAPRLARCVFRGPRGWLGPRGDWTLHSPYRTDHTVKTWPVGHMTWRLWLGPLFWYPPYHLVKSLQLVWRSGTSRFHLLVPDLQASWSDLTSYETHSIMGRRIVVLRGMLVPMKGCLSVYVTFVSILNIKWQIGKLQVWCGGLSDEYTHSHCECITIHFIQQGSVV